MLGAAASGRNLRLCEFTFARCVPLGSCANACVKFFLARCASPDDPTIGQKTNMRECQFSSQHCFSRHIFALFSFLISSHFFLYLLQRFCIQKSKIIKNIKNMSDTDKLTSYIFSFSRSRATRRLVFFV